MRNKTRKTSSERTIRKGSHFSKSMMMISIKRDEKEGERETRRVNNEIA
jgi:hypothetical protein